MFNVFSVPRTTGCRGRKAEALRLEIEKAKDQGLPSRTKVQAVQLTYTCKKCGQPQNKETGHSQYYGQTYCPYEEGQIPKSDYEIILENTRNSKISLLHNIRHLECSNTLDSDLQHTDGAFQNRKIPMLQRRLAYK